MDLIKTYRYKSTFKKDSYYEIDSITIFQMSLAIPPIPSGWIGSPSSFYRILNPDARTTIQASFEGNIPCGFYLELIVRSNDKTFIFTNATVTYLNMLSSESLPEGRITCSELKTLNF